MRNSLLKKNGSILKKLKFGALIITLVPVFVTGCGSRIPEGYYVLDSFSDSSEDIENQDPASCGLEGSYVVIHDCEGYITLKDTPEDIEYDPDEQVIHTDFGDIDAQLDGKTLILADRNITMRFVLSKDEEPSKPDYPVVKVPEPEPEPEPDIMTEEKEDTDEASGDTDNNEEDTGETADADLPSIDEFWNSYWFGYWTIDAWDDSYKQYEDSRFPVFGQSVYEADGTSSIDLWDNGEYYVAQVTGNNNGYGLTSLGTFVSENGYFMDGDVLGHSDWNIDPGLFDHKDSICIEGRYEIDGDRIFDYTIVLVRWGCKWDDFAEEELPYEYDWYLEQIGSGTTDPNALEIPES